MQQTPMVIIRLEQEKYERLIDILNTRFYTDKDIPPILQDISKNIIYLNKPFNGEIHT